MPVTLYNRKLSKSKAGLNFRIDLQCSIHVLELRSGLRETQKKYHQLQAGSLQTMNDMLLKSRYIDATNCFQIVDMTNSFSKTNHSLHAHLAFPHAVVHHITLG